MSSGRRVKYVVMLAVVVGSLLALGASTQTWITVTFSEAAEHPGAVSVQGSAASQALAALSLAGLALALALAIAGRVIRVILAVLGLIVGVSVVLSSASVANDPIGAAGGAITTATGIAGREPVKHLVKLAAVTAWPTIAIAGGVILGLASIAVIVTSHRWPGASKRYGAVRFAPVDAPASALDAAEVDAAGAAGAAGARGVSGAQGGGAASGADAGSALSPGDPASASGASSGPPVPTAESETAARDAAIDSWDELSRGQDPTR